MIKQSILIERWENVERVLSAMSEHDRKNHWDMGVWGRQTGCGTIGCAAGHCGLDPWFRKRGFKMDFDQHGDVQISNVRTFFGNEGSWGIFFDSSRRPVECVIEEVRAYVASLLQALALHDKIGAPAAGKSWSEHGGIYAGIVTGQDEAPYALIAGPELDDGVKWRAAMDWATSLEIDGFRDFSLLSRAELRRVADTVPQLFQPTCYWSREQHASFRDYAWRQDFNDGFQDDWGKVDRLRARAFRRLVIDR